MITGATPTGRKEVAKLVEKRHTDFLRDIHGYIKIMNESTERKIASSDFLIVRWITACDEFSN